MTDIVERLRQIEGQPESRKLTPKEARAIADEIETLQAKIKLLIHLLGHAYKKEKL